MKKFAIALVLTLTSVNAFADQCQITLQKQAGEAVRILLEPNAKIQSLCEPCGQTKASEPIKVEIVSARVFSSTQLEIEVNGKPIDLAYTYVEGLNLAKLVGCPAQGVSDQIK